MAFKIGSSTSRPHKLAKRIAAFEDDDNDAPANPATAVSASAPAAASLTAPAAASGQAPAHAGTSEGDASRWIEKGSAFAEQGDTAAALRCWDQALLITPASSQVHEMRAQVLNLDGRTFEAVQAAQQAVRLRPEWPEAHITLARAQLNYGEPLLALSSYQAAAKLQPSHPDLVQELPTAQMYAKLHSQQQQQQPGSRAHVVMERHPTRDGEEAQAEAEAEAEAAAAAVAECSAAAVAECPADAPEGDDVMNELDEALAGSLGVLRPATDKEGRTATGAGARSARVEGGS